MLHRHGGGDSGQGHELFQSLSDLSLLTIVDVLVDLSQGVVCSISLILHICVPIDIDLCF